jgi:hypothetical protein
MPHCCNCYSDKDVKKFYSEFIAALDTDTEFYSYNCYSKVASEEEELIQFSLAILHYYI